MWWNSSAKLWCVSMEKDIDTMEIYACCTSLDYDPSSCSGSEWTIYSENEKAFVKDQELIISRYILHAYYFDMLRGDRYTSDT